MHILWGVFAYNAAARFVPVIANDADCSKDVSRWQGLATPSSSAAAAAAAGTRNHDVDPMLSRPIIT